MTKKKNLFQLLLKSVSPTYDAERERKKNMKKYKERGRQIKDTRVIQSEGERDREKGIQERQLGYRDKKDQVKPH